MVSPAVEVREITHYPRERHLRLQDEGAAMVEFRQAQETSGAGTIRAHGDNILKRERPDRGTARGGVPRPRPDRDNGCG
jgi:hypothetical protein